MQPLLSGVALAATAGLNAFIPILILAVYDRVSDSFVLERPYDFISSTAGILILLILVTIELLLDKIPGVDAVVDLVGYVLRPASGAFLLMAVTYGHDSIDIVVAMTLGLLIAGAVHVVKARSRLRITQATNGVANPIVSLAEDMVAAVVATLALVAPIAGIVSAILGGGLLYAMYNRFQVNATMRAAIDANRPVTGEAATFPPVAD